MVNSYLLANKESINTYTQKVIDTTPLSSDPFSHIYIKDFFPEDLYSELSSLFPSNELLTQAGTKSTHNRLIKSRSIFVLFDQDMNLLPNQQKLTYVLEWMKFYLMPAIGNKLGINYNPYTYSIRGAFVYDEAGYQKLPHTDHPSKLFTLLFYMSDCSTGTTIVKPKLPNFKDAQGDDYHYNLFNEVITYPFKQNCSLAIARTDQSFHCVHRVSDNLPRKALHLHVWRAS
jgi:hypothetical protein